VQRFDPEKLASDVAQDEMSLPEVIADIFALERVSIYRVLGLSG
jgi:hypothetical protein